VLCVLRSVFVCMFSCCLVAYLVVPWADPSLSLSLSLSNLVHFFSSCMWCSGAIQACLVLIHSSLGLDGGVPAISALSSEQRRCLLRVCCLRRSMLNKLRALPRLGHSHKTAFLRFSHESLSKKMELVRFFVRLPGKMWTRALCAWLC
jgi:hypothetical protein